MRRAILTFLVAAPITAVAIWRVSPAAALGIIFLSHALVLYPTLRPNVQWLGPVITCFETSGPEVWLTIDDGPADDTTAILELFDSRDVKATFFCKGTLAERKTDVVREILRRGHTVGNHSYSHPSATFWCLWPARIRHEIEEGARVIEAISGRPPRYFRAPVGMKNPAVHPALRRSEMLLIGWSTRAFDTQTADVELIAARVVRAVRPGSVILMHQGLSHSVRALTRVVDELQKRGYRFVLPDEARLKTKR